MKPIPAVGLSPEDQARLEKVPQRCIMFSCKKCDGELFTITYAIYDDHSGAFTYQCASCGAAVVPTEPRLNGLH